MSNHNDHWMREAVIAARAGNTPFGAVLVDTRGNAVSAVNSTAKDGATAHAEMNVLVKDKLAQLDYTNCGELTLYTTAEPCPMCMGAIIWTGIGTIVYGASIAQLSSIMKQIDVSSRTLAERSWYQPNIIGSVLEAECLSLFPGS